uniref:Uncharacterized protein n=1 Tax=Bionectria ochroleuca TaxID=29856 RepID=A0A8H7K4H2_BIOOC
MDSPIRLENFLISTAASRYDAPLWITGRWNADRGYTNRNIADSIQLSRQSTERVPAGLRSKEGHILRLYSQPPMTNLSARDCQIGQQGKGGNRPDVLFLPSELQEIPQPIQGPGLVVSGPFPAPSAPLLRHLGLVHHAI